MGGTRDGNTHGGPFIAGGKKKSGKDRGAGKGIPTGTQADGPCPLKKNSVERALRGGSMVLEKKKGRHQHKSEPLVGIRKRGGRTLAEKREHHSKRGECRGEVRVLLWGEVSVCQLSMGP